MFTGHSDAAKLKERAEDIKLLSPEELKQRHIEIKVRLFEMGCQRLENLWTSSLTISCPSIFEL